MRHVRVVGRTFRSPHFRGHGAEPYRAGRRERLGTRLEHFGRDLVNHVLGPGLDVLRVAALHEHHETLATESARKVARLQLLAQQAREVGEEILAGQHAKLLVQGFVLVGLDIDQAAHAALGRFSEPGAQLFDEVAAVQEAGRRVALHRVLELALVLARVRNLGRHADLDARLTVELGADELELERRVMTAHHERGCMQRVPCPLALNACDQGALDRGVVVRIEGVHEGRADDVLGI